MAFSVPLVAAASEAEAVRLAYDAMTIGADAIMRQRIFSFFYGNSGMPKVLETKLKRKARKMGLGKQEQQLIRNSLINIESE